VIPGNDDALRAIRLFASKIAEAVNAGRGIRESAQAEEAATEGEGDERARRARAVRAARAEQATSPASV
jgi:small subunit ribosomal protein S2